MKNKIISLLIIILIYALMFSSYFFLNKWLTINNMMIKLFVTSLIWTVYIWIFSLIFRNSSIYGPYWSTVPIFIVLLYLTKVTKINFQTYLLVGALIIWGVRLLINFFIRFKNLKEEDWRYHYYRQKYPKGWFFLNLFGCHFLPSFIIYMALVPVFYYIDLSTVKNINLSTIIGLIIIISGIIIELVSDYQMDYFKRKTTDLKAVNQSGLWSLSRHPNYLGELMVWWGAFLMMLSLDEKKFLLLLGPLLITLLILIITIPLMEKHLLKNKKNYQEYLEKTNMLLIFPKHKSNI